MIGVLPVQVAVIRFALLMGRNCLEPGDALYERRPGAFICFANPDHSAADASVFWTHKAYSRVVVAHVHNHAVGGLDGIISLEKFPCRKTLLKTVTGEQYLLLADQRRAAQVKCIGESISIFPFSLEPTIENFPNVEGSHRLIRNLADLYRNRRFSNSSSVWTVEGLRHRDALAAFDMRSQGYSYREIATFLYGEKSVVEDWNDPRQILKKRLVRSVKRGQRMVDGGYKSLLK